MSTILKALRRLEEDNTSHVQRSLRDEVMAARRPEPRRRTRSWVGVVVALLAVAFLSGSAGVWLALREQPAPIQMATGEIPVQRSTSLAPPPERLAPQARPGSEIAAAEPAPGAASLGPAGIAATAPSPQVPPVPSVSAPPPRRSPLEDLAMVARPVPVAPAPVSAAPAPRPRAESRQSQVIQPEPIRVEPMRAEPIRSEPIRVEALEPAQDPTVERNAVSEIPVLVHAQIPELIVRTTRWHPSPERRVVELELPAEGRRVTLHEGDVVGPLVVGEITLSGVVLRHGAVEIQGRVGETVSAE